MTYQQTNAIQKTLNGLLYLLEECDKDENFNSEIMKRNLFSKGKDINTIINELMELRDGE